MFQRLSKTAVKFKKFIARGNALDLAVGVVLGTAFGKVISSLVDDLIMPVISILSGKVNFTSWFFALDFNPYPSLDAAKAAKIPVITYGNLIQVGINFLLVGIALFFVTALIQKVQKKDLTATELTTKECPFCASNISLKAKVCPFCQREQSITG